jgi:hypothetical protein
MLQAKMYRNSVSYLHQGNDHPGVKDTVMANGNIWSGIMVTTSLGNKVWIPQSYLRKDGTLMKKALKLIAQADKRKAKVVAVA